MRSVMTLKVSQENLKIILVEEDPSIQLLMSEELDEDGYEVAVCSSLDQLQNKIKQFRPHLVIMEVGANREHGLNTLQNVRNKYYNLPVIVWTQYYSYRHDFRIMAADYFVLKKVDLGELKGKMRKALEGSLALSTGRRKNGAAPEKSFISLVRKK